MDSPVSEDWPTKKSLAADQAQIRGDQGSGLQAPRCRRAPSPPWGCRVSLPSRSTRQSVCTMALQLLHRLAGAMLLHIGQAHAEQDHAADHRGRAHIAHQQRDPQITSNWMTSGLRHRSRISRRKLGFLRPPRSFGPNRSRAASTSSGKAPGRSPRAGQGFFRRKAAEIHQLLLMFGDAAGGGLRFLQEGRGVDFLEDGAKHARFGGPPGSASPASFFIPSAPST